MDILRLPYKGTCPMLAKRGFPPGQCCRNLINRADQMSPIEYAKNVRVPTFIIQVRDDALTKASDVQQIFAANRRDLFIPCACQTIQSTIRDDLTHTPLLQPEPWH